MAYMSSYDSNAYEFTDSELMHYYMFNFITCLTQMLTIRQLLGRGGGGPVPYMKPLRVNVLAVRTENNRKTFVAGQGEDMITVQVYQTELFQKVIEDGGVILNNFKLTNDVIHMGRGSQILRTGVPQVGADMKQRAIDRLFPPTTSLVSY